MIFEYNGDGLRSQKKIQKGTNSFEVHNYYWSDGKLLAETIQLNNNMPISLHYHYSHAGLRDSVISNGALFQAGISTMVYGGCLIASTFDSQIESDMEAISWNPFNNDANALLNDPNSKVSFYRGVPVIRQNTLNTCSFGIIFVQGGINATDLNHEWGHNVQLMLLGPVKYGLGIAIPSVINYHSNPTDYYSYPWERSADWFGGANNGPYDKHSLQLAIWYLLLLLAL